MCRLESSKGEKLNGDTGFQPVLAPYARAGSPGHEMNALMPDYLAVQPDQLGRGTNVRVRVLGDMASIARDLAQVMLDEIVDAQKRQKPATFIVPVGPVDQYAILAQKINEQ